jgi:hypothetical protein
MVTHMGFHAMVPEGLGQGRDARLVNPLKARSRFGAPPTTLGGTKSQVAACSGETTRRFGPAGRPPRTPAAPRPGTPGPPDSGCAEMDRRVHAPWLAWTGLCAPTVPGSDGRPVSGCRWETVAAATETGRCRRTNSTSQCRPSVIRVEFYYCRPSFHAGPCTCSAQFTYHSVVGVSE